MSNDAGLAVAAGNDTAAATDSNLATPYLIATIFGGAAVIFSRELWLFAVAVMAAYGLYGYSRARTGSYVLEFSDSFYYLGFVLTLAALLGSLRPFEWIQGQAPDPADVLKHFGLGMVTSLIGVVGRTTMQMFHRTPDETLASVNERIAEEAQQYLVQLEAVNLRAARMLTESADAVHAQIDAGAKRIGVAMEGLAQEYERIRADAARIDVSPLSARCEAITRALGEMEAGVRGRIEQMQGTAGVIDGFISQVTSQVGSSARTLDAAVAQLGGTITGTGETLDGLRARAEQVLPDPAVFQGRLTQIVGGMETASARIGQASARSAASLERLSTDVDAAGRKTGESLAGIASHVDALGQKVSAVSTAQLQAAVNTLAERMSAIVRHAEAQGEQMASGELARMRDAVRTFAEDVQRVDEVLAEVLTATRQRIQALR